MTYASFLTGLSNLVVTGVTKRFSEPPAQLNAAQLPAQYVMLPAGTATVATLAGGLEFVECVAALRIVMEPIGQNTPSANWTKATTLMDALHSALAANVDTLYADKWSMSVAEEPIGDVVYWVIAAEVTGSF